MPISLFEACQKGNSGHVKSLIDEKVRRFSFLKAEVFVYLNK
jgi:hypothetical protein